jgi:predicted regulator of Ras-like GTPase activity (Roadblock/LC7/MglB family)
MINMTDLEDRIVKCNKILEENPNSQIFAALAEAYRKKGDLDKAFRVCQNGLKVHPSYGSAHLVMAKINLDKGLYDWAEAEVEKAIEFDGVSRATELLLAEVYIYKGEFNKACRLLEKLHQDDPGNDHIVKLLDIARKIPLEGGRTPAPGTIGEPASRKTVQAAPVIPRATESLEDTVSSAANLPEINYKKLIKAIVSTPDVDGVLLINKDGLVVEAEWNVPGETDLVGALAMESAKLTSQQMEVTELGTLSSMMIETSDSLHYFAAVKGKLLAVVCTNKVNLGSLKLKLTSLLPRLVD